MKKLKGITSSKGIALGRGIFINKDTIYVDPFTISDVDNEIDKFLLAQERSINQLEALYNGLVFKISQDNSMIFKSHQMIIKDKDFINKVYHYIKVFKYNAAYAIFKASQDYIVLFKNVKSEYISQRSDDIKDIMRRLIDNISDENKKDDFNINEEGILFTQELMPSEILTIDKEKISGIVTKYGGKTSHTSILAKSMGIPMIIGVNFDINEIKDKFIILDGILEEVIVSPDDKTITEYLKKQEDIKENEQRLKLTVYEPDYTLDKKEIEIMANITTSNDVDNALENGAKGIGLFRSEFLYIDRQSGPSEEELFNEYKSALMKSDNKEVIIRTIDLGSDKNMSYIKYSKEPNPALGLRALRLCFNHLDIFKTQLRALIRASVYGKLGLLIPMVVSLSEVIKVKDLIDEVKKSLYSENMQYNVNIPLGIMIETPSAVMISDLLAKHVDFFSIGTNDLVQFTLACDRDNVSLMEMYTSNHIAILRMIKTVVDNAHNNNIWVEVCGEVAGDLTMVDKMVGLGVDRLSVDIQNLLATKDVIRHTNYIQSRKNVLNMIYPN